MLKNFHATDFANFQGITFDNNNYLLNIETLQCARISKEFAEALERFQQHHILSVEQSICLYTSWKAIVNSLSPKQVLRAHTNLIALNIETISQCTLNCAYCFSRISPQPPQKMPLNLVTQAVKFFLGTFPKHELFVDFTVSGEALLYIKAIHHLFQMYPNEINNGRLHVNFSTNGTLFSKALVTLLREQQHHNYHARLTLSIDGPQDIHDVYRFDTSGKGSFQKVLQNFHRWQHAIPGIISSVNAVYTPDNVHLLRRLLFFKELEISECTLKPYRGLDPKFEWTLDNITAVQKEYWELATAICQQARQNDFGIFSLIFNFYDFWGRILQRLLYRVPVHRRCDAGNQLFMVDLQGHIKPCPSLNSSQYILGNIYDGFSKDRNLFLDVEVTNNSFCKTCVIKYVCGGECLVYTSGEPYGQPNPALCELKKYLVKLSLFVLDQLSQIENFRKTYYKVS